MKLNTVAETIIAEALQRSQHKTIAERWELYEGYKGLLSVTCTWGVEYKSYMDKLVEALRI